MFVRTIQYCTDGNFNMKTPSYQWQLVFMLGHVHVVSDKEIRNHVYPQEINTPTLQLVTIPHDFNCAASFYFV